jgi:hypothetical protein
MKRKFAIAGIVIGALLTLGPLWGFLGTMFAMNSAFSGLAGKGISDPHALSSTIGGVLFFQMFGIIACPIGITLCIICVFQISRTPPPVPSIPATGTPDFKA